MRIHTVKTLLSLVAFYFSCADIALPASFDCTQTSSKTEVAICGDAEVSNLDDVASSEYQAAKKRLAQPDDLVEEQRQWLSGTRNDCDGDLTCLRRVYRDRIDFLEFVGDFKSAPAAEINVAPEAPTPSTSRADNSQNLIEQHSESTTAAEQHPQPTADAVSGRQPAQNDTESNIPVVGTEENKMGGWVVIILSFLAICFVWKMLMGMGRKSKIQAKESEERAERQAKKVRLSKYLEGEAVNITLSALALEYLKNGRTGSITSLGQLSEARIEQVDTILRALKINPQFAFMANAEYLPMIEKCKSEFLEIDIKPALARRIFNSILSEFAQSMSLTENDKAMLDDIVPYIDESLRPVLLKRKSQMSNITAVRARQFDKANFITEKLSVKLNSDERVIFLEPQISFYHLEEMEVATTDGQTSTAGVTSSSGTIELQTLSGGLSHSSSSRDSNHKDTNSFAASYSGSSGTSSTQGTFGSKTTTIKQDHLQEVESGDLIVTTQRVWFVGPNRVLNIKFSDILRHKVLDDGVLINKDGEQKPLVFKSQTLDAWYFDVSVRAGSFIN